MSARRNFFCATTRTAFDAGAGAAVILGGLLLSNP